MSLSYPPAPWTLRGQALAMPLALRCADLSIPRPLVPLSVGGRVPGLAIVAQYGAGSVLEYHELAVLAAVRHRSRIGAFVTALWVDDPASVAGGREIWNLDKRLAAFAWTAVEGGRSIEVRHGEATLLRLRYRLATPSTRLPFALPLRVMTVRDAGVESFRTRVGGRVRIARLPESAALPVPGLTPDSVAFAADGPAPVRFARSLRTGVAFEVMQAVVDAPRPI